MASRTFSFGVAVALFVAACERGPPIAGVRTSVAARSGSDSVMVRARWAVSDGDVVFLWRNAAADGAAAFSLADTSAEPEVTFQLPRPEADVPSRFCVRTLRPADGARGGEACAEYTLLARPPPLPDSGRVHLALVQRTTQYRNQTCLETREVCQRRNDAGECTRWRSVCARWEPRDTLSCLTLRWDSVPGATAFRVELRRDGQLLSQGNVNDDSCPACEDLGLGGGRWPCFEFQQGCRFNVWPYFSTGWCTARRREPQALTATIVPLRAGTPVAGARPVEWPVPGKP